MLQVDALLKPLELQESAQYKGQFALFNCLVLGHTKYNGVQRVYCNPFPAKIFYGSQPWKHMMILKMVIMCIIYIISIIAIMCIIPLICFMSIVRIIAIIVIIAYCFVVGWLESVGSRVGYELDYKKPVLYVVLIQSILGKLPMVTVPVGDTGTIPHTQHLSRRSRRPQAGCRRWMPDVVRQLVGIGMVP
jgi:hypothetical protein